MPLYIPFICVFLMVSLPILTLVLFYSEKISVASLGYFSIALLFTFGIFLFSIIRRSCKKFLCFLTKAEDKRRVITGPATIKEIRELYRAALDLIEKKDADTSLFRVYKEKQEKKEAVLKNYIKKLQNKEKEARVKKRQERVKHSLVRRQLYSTLLQLFSGVIKTTEVIKSQEVAFGEAVRTRLTPAALLKDLRATCDKTENAYKLSTRSAEDILETIKSVDAFRVNLAVLKPSKSALRASRLTREKRGDSSKDFFHTQKIEKIAFQASTSVTNAGASIGKVIKNFFQLKTAFYASLDEALELSQKAAVVQRQIDVLAFHNIRSRLAMELLAKKLLIAFKLLEELEFAAPCLNKDVNREASTPYLRYDPTHTTGELFIDNLYQSLCVVFNDFHKLARFQEPLSVLGGLFSNVALFIQLVARIESAYLTIEDDYNKKVEAILQQMESALCFRNKKAFFDVSELLRKTIIKRLEVISQRRPQKPKDTKAVTA